MRSHQVPAVPPKDSGEIPEAPDPVLFSGSPAHPFLDRLFCRGRLDRDRPASARGS